MEGGKLLAALGAFTVDDEVDEEKAHLLHAHLACLCDGIQLGHIDVHAFDAFRAVLRENLMAAGILDSFGNRTGLHVRAEPMWNLFADALILAAAEPHPSGRPIALADTRDGNADFCGRELVTIGRLEFQTELTRRGASGLGWKKLERVSQADIVRKADHRQALAEIVACCNHALEQRMVSSSEYLKGDAKSITWITPVEAHTELLLSRPDDYGLNQADITDLRDLLGLWAENGKSKRPLAAFFLDCRMGLAAPNVFTAQGYERFRHRPPESLAESPNSGLTYNLDHTSASLRPGACEIVADAITLTQVKRIEAGGQPSGIKFDRDGEFGSHRRYAEDTHRGRSLDQILSNLESLIS